MSNKRIKADQLTSTIMEYLKEFEDVTTEACEKGVTETAKTALSELRSAHPPGSGVYGSWDSNTRDNSKGYNKGWRITQTKRDKEKHAKRIHNATDYQLTHLLEKGHALRQGGRTAAFPHIAPVEQKCEIKLIDNIKKHI